MSQSTTFFYSLILCGNGATSLTRVGTSDFNILFSYDGVIDTVNVIEIKQQVFMAYHIRGKNTINVFFYSVQDSPYKMTYDYSQTITVGTNQINVFQVGILNNEINIIGFNSDGYYKIILFSKQNNSYLFSDPIKIIEWMESYDVILNIA